MKFLPYAFFVVTLGLGIFLFRDYGVSWDEPIQNDLGNANWSYVLHGSQGLFSLQNHFYGPFAEMIEVIPQQLNPHLEPSAVWLTRHLINYLIFWMGTIFLFLLAKEIFGNILYALVCPLILFLTPGIFASAFYNSKDIPLLSFFIIGNYLLLRFMKQPTVALAVVFGIVCGMVFSIRIVGVLIPAFTLAFFLLNVSNGNLASRTLKFLVIYLLTTAIFCIVFSPALWHDPVGGLVQSFSIFSHYPYDDPQFFLGHLLTPQQLPWYYIPVWMGVTIPVLWQILFVTGLICLIIIILRNAKNLFKASWQWLLIAAWCFTPWIIVLILHSALYDQWRHLFFIYPAFILLAVLGMVSVTSESFFFRDYQTRHRLMLSIRITAAAFITQTVFVIQFMTANHPYENVYFNMLAGNYPQRKFDLDYWGLAYRQALQYLVENTNEKTIKVCWQNAPGKYNQVWLSPSDQQRIREMPYDSCKYFLTNFRFKPESYVDSAWHIIRVNNYSIIAIEKLR